MPSDDQIHSYRRGYAALKNLKQDRHFLDWLDYARAYETAQIEAMHRAGSNSPTGKTYNQQFNQIMVREGLVERTGPAKHQQFPNPTDRKDCIAMLRNYDYPIDDPRRPSIKTWRAGLSESERVRLNHPSSIMRRWKKETQPLTEKDAAKANDRVWDPKRDALLRLLNDTEATHGDAHHDAHRTVDLRLLLTRVRRRLGL